MTFAEKIAPSHTALLVIDDDDPEPMRMRRRVRSIGGYFLEDSSIDGGRLELSDGASFLEQLIHLGRGGHEIRLEPRRFRVVPPEGP
jgi:hypothetical protein